MGNKRGSNWLVASLVLIAPCVTSQALGATVDGALQNSSSATTLGVGGSGLYGTGGSGIKGVGGSGMPHSQASISSRASKPNSVGIVTVNGLGGTGIRIRSSGGGTTARGRLTSGLVSKYSSKNLNQKWIPTRPLSQQNTISAADLRIQRIQANRVLSSPAISSKVLTKKPVANGVATPRPHRLRR